MAFEQKRLFNKMNFFTSKLLVDYISFLFCRLYLSVYLELIFLNIFPMSTKKNFVKECPISKNIRS